MKRYKLASAVILVLVIAAAAAAAIHLSSRPQVPAGSVRVEWDGQAAQVDLSALELSEVRGTLRNGKGEERTVEGRGMLLSAVLERAGVPEYDQVAVTADDSYSAVVTAEEAALPDKAYLLLQEDGVRLVVFGDENSKRSVSGVAVLSVS